MSDDRSLRRAIRPDGIASAALLWALAAAAIFLLIRLPQLPYNLRKVFAAHGAFATSTILGLALVWIGIGVGIGGQIVARTRAVWIVLPLTVVVVAAVEYALLGAIVPLETIEKVVGAPILYRDATEFMIWGSGAADFLRAHVLPELMNGAERVGRFVALLAFFITFAVAWHAALARGAWTGPLVAAIAPMLLFHLIAFDFPATDNLEELIATAGPWGVGGADVLAVLAFVLGLNAAWLGSFEVQDRQAWALSAGLTVLGVAASWVLIQLATASQISRYGATYGALDFMLGPDRVDLLPAAILLVRWSVAYLSLIALLAFGIRATGGWLERGGNPLDRRI
jgi:hypothetical protein